MSLPNYIVNLEEMLGYLEDKIELNVSVDGIGGSIGNEMATIIDLLKKILMLIYDRGVQQIYGLRQHIPSVVGVFKLTKTFDFDIMLTGISYSQSGWKYQDSWDLEVDGTKLFDSFTKEIGEHKHFNVFYFVPAGTPINIYHHNDSGNSKLIWFDIEYLNLSLPNIIPPIPEPPSTDIPIDNPYDWMFVLRWEDNTSTDIDFHLYLDRDEDTHVWYSNKSITQGEDNLAYLNSDFTSHGANGRDEQPEILTAYGYEDRVINIFVTNFDGGSISENVTVEVIRKTATGDKTIQLIEIEPEEITGEKTLHIGYVENNIFTFDLKEIPYDRNVANPSYGHI